MLWDVFCRVIDNHGDVGVCWRLAADLGCRGERVRLWIDDASALRWMAPAGARGVELVDWTSTPADLAPGDVVVEAFGCDPPQAFVRRMAARAVPPVWINLEYLSAESYVERSHRLASPQFAGAAVGMTKWFWYPGFTTAAGGLIREPGLMARREAFDGSGWLDVKVGPRRDGERVVSLFCYPNAALDELLNALSDRPTLLLATAGHAAREVSALIGDTGERGALRVACLSALTQQDFDHLLWASDLNCVRGEDSFVRAQWAGKPFVWQIYPQHDDAHAAKLEAFLALYLAEAPAPLAAALRAMFLRWNGLAAGPLRLPPDTEARHHALAWRTRLLAQSDLVTQLLGFVAEKR